MHASLWSRTALRSEPDRAWESGKFAPIALARSAQFDTLQNCEMRILVSSSTIVGCGMRLFNVELHTRVILLAGIDALCVMTVTNYVLFLKSYNQQLSHDSGTLVAYIFLFAIVLSIFLMGLYQRSYLKPRRLIPNLLLSFAIAIFLVPLVLGFSSLKAPSVGVIGAVLLANFLVIFLVRLVVSAASAMTRWKKRVLVLGDDSTQRALVDLHRQAPHAGFVCVGTLAPDTFTKDDWRDTVSAIFRTTRPHEVVFPSNLDLTEACWGELLTFHFKGVRVISLADFIEREFRRLQLDDVDALKHILAHGSRRGPIALLVKRAFDIVISAALLVLFLPLVAATALAIWMEDRGPLLYRQRRTGLGNKPFEILKFRSMRPDAEADGRPRWASSGDARITRVGAVIRRCRLDEIPQLVNVLRGDMSLVGPRPERPEIVATLQREIPLYEYRHLVRPGITGWAQINYPYGRSLEDAIEKTRYDLYYIKNGTSILDLAIILQTVRVILLLEGL